MRITSVWTSVNTQKTEWRGRSDRGVAIVLKLFWHHTADLQLPELWVVPRRDPLVFCLHIFSAPHHRPYSPDNEREREIYFSDNRVEMTKTFKQIHNVSMYLFIITLASLICQIIILTTFKRQPLKKTMTVCTLLCFLRDVLCRNSSRFERSDTSRLDCLPSSRLKASAMATSSCPGSEQGTRGGEGDNDRVLWASDVPETKKCFSSLKLFSVSVQNTNQICFAVVAKFSHGGASQFLRLNDPDLNFF